MGTVSTLEGACALCEAGSRDRRGVLLGPGPAVVLIGWRYAGNGIAVASLLPSQWDAAPGSVCGAYCGGKLLKESNHCVPAPASDALLAQRVMYGSMPHIDSASPHTEAMPLDD